MSDERVLPVSPPPHMPGTEAPWLFSPLSAPIDVTQQHWPQGTLPLISVLCFTYNHERTIAGALDGFLAQATTFPIEILVHDDASTDRTAQIVSDYARRFPSLVVAICQTTNQLSRGNYPERILYERARGKFIAFCEGDDYWIAPDKLAMQAAIMADDEVVLSGAICERVVDDGSGERCIGTIQPPPGKTVLQRRDFFERYILHTSTCMFRRDALYESLDWIVPLPNNDEATFATLAGRGTVRFIERVVSRYRFGIGTWTGRPAIARYRGAFTTWDAIVRHLHPSAEEMAVLTRRQREDAAYYWQQLTNTGRPRDLLWCLWDCWRRGLIDTMPALRTAARLMPEAWRTSRKPRTSA